MGVPRLFLWIEKMFKKSVNGYRILTCKLREYITRYTNLRNIYVILFSSNVSREGENKIMDYIRLLTEEEKQLEITVYGMDADLIMLTMISGINNIYIFRDSQFINNIYIVVNILTIKKELMKYMNRTEENNYIHEFIGVGFFIGNDFYHKISMFYMLDERLTKMIDILKTSYYPIVKNKQINLIGLKEFVYNLSLIEEVYLKDQIYKNVQDKFKNKLLEDYYFSPNLDFEGYRHAFYDKAGVKNEIDITNMCKDYISTILWMYDYYCIGLSSWDWYYKWNYAPFMIDLYNYLSSISKFPESKHLGSPSYPIIQLLNVLPRKSKDLVPIEYRSIFDNEYLYPSNFEIDYEGKIHDYQGIVLLQFIDQSIIKKEYDFHHDTERKRNMFMNNILFLYNSQLSYTYISDYGIILDCKTDVMII